MEALYAIASINAFPNKEFSFSGVLGSSLSCEIIAKPTGKIITDVAVLLIHMDKNAVAIMNPKIILLLFTPTRLMILRAILLCNFHF